MSVSLEVTLVLNEALDALDEPEIPAAVNDLIKVAFAPKDPEISAPICAELDNSVLPNSDSAVVILVLIEELAAVNDPEMSVPIWAHPDSIPAPKSAICPDDDRIAVLYSPVKEPLNDPVKIAPSPFISAICVIVGLCILMSY